MHIIGTVIGKNQKEQSQQKLREGQKSTGVPFHDRTAMKIMKVAARLCYGLFSSRQILTVTKARQEWVQPYLEWKISQGYEKLSVRW